MIKLRKSAWIAWFFCIVVSLGSLIFAIVTVIDSGSVGRPLRLAGDVLTAIFPMLVAIPAALIISRQSRNVIGWLLMTPALVLTASNWVNHYLTGFQAAPPPDTFLIWLMAWFFNWSWLALIIPLLLLPLLFPTGRLLTKRWRWVIFLAIGMILIFLVGDLGTRVYSFSFVSWTISNPVGFIPDGLLQIILPIWAILLVILTVASLASIIVRFKRAVLVEREQIKWLLYACVLFGLVYIPGIYINISASSQILMDIANLLFSLAILAIPTVIAIAILRYHLFDIDVIIRLTLVYAAVTALLGLLYAGGVVLLQAGLRMVSKETSGIDVMITTLVIAALFNPLRKRIQEFIDRRFYRQKYNADQALNDLANSARNGSDLDALTGMLVGMVQKTLQPTYISLHLNLNKNKEPISATRVNSYNKMNPDP